VHFGKAFRAACRARGAVDQLQQFDGLGRHFVAQGPPFGGDTPERVDVVGRQVKEGAGR